MWVPRTPKRADFCGCPPCPICYAWADGNGTDPVDGIEQMARDMLGRAPSPQEKATLEQSAEKIHIGNLARVKETEERIAAREAAEEQRWADIKMDAFLKQQRREAARPKPTVDSRPCLDDLPAEAFEEKPPEPVSHGCLSTLVAKLVRSCGGVVLHRSSSARSSLCRPAKFNRRQNGAVAM
jgi:hypothetical protein